MTKNPRRRDFLKTVSATAATASIAGCLGGGSDDSDTDTSMDDDMSDDEMAEGGMSDGGMNDSTMSDGEMTEGGMTEGEMTESGMESMASTLSLDVSMLPELSMGHYEGWAIFGGEKVSTGTFAAGDDLTFEVNRDLSMADEIVVTIEPDDDPSMSPSGVVVLSGSLSEGVADLSFPVSFADAMGSYILATPTNGGDSDELSGVWFLNPDGPSASLDLPDLPMGWTYEGWVVFDGTPVSTGRFSDPAMADDDKQYAGSMSPPPFPGADFLENAPDGLSFPTDLTGTKVVVSVEPDIEGMDPTGTAPFAIKPLVGTVPGDATDHTSYDLSPMMDTTPSGMAEVKSESM